MAVIGGHHWQVFALCQFKEAVVDDGLLLEAIVLQLEVEIVFVKFRVLPCDPAGLVHVARQDGLGISPWMQAVRQMMPSEYSLRMFQSTRGL